MAGSKKARTPRTMRGGGSVAPAKLMGAGVTLLGGDSGATESAAAVGGMGSYTVIVGLVVVILALIGLIGYLITLNLRDVAVAGVPTAPRAPVGPMAPLIPNVMIGPVATRTNPFSDPLAPPLKNDGTYFPPDSGDIRGIPMIASATGGAATCNSSACMGAAGVPINMQTRGYSPDFSQIGLLTRERADRTEDTSFRDPMILPLFGRRVLNGRDKYQYYTMSNTGAVNTKLPVKVRGRNCVNEYGCDELMDRDTVYVEGYNDVFRASIYENGTFSYIPYL